MRNYFKISSQKIENKNEIYEWNSLKIFFKSEFSLLNVTIFYLLLKLSHVSTLFTELIGK